MPNANRVQTVYLTGGDPDTLNESTLYAPGHLGVEFEYNDRSYQIVKDDSGTTAAIAGGVVAANDLAFWKDKDNYLVTNDPAQTPGGNTANAFRNFVAGVFRNAVTAGNYTAILKRGDNIPVNATGGGVGQTAIANSGTDSDIAAVAVGTASTYVPLGIFREATGDTTAGMANVDLSIPLVP